MRKSHSSYLCVVIIVYIWLYVSYSAEFVNIAEYAVDFEGAENSLLSLELNDVENDRFSFDVDYREEMHPSIRPLEYRYKASTALSAKFR